MRKTLKVLYLLFILSLVLSFLNLFITFRGILVVFEGFLISYLIVILIPHFELRNSNKSLRFIILKGIGLIGLVSVLDSMDFFLKDLFNVPMGEFAGLQLVMAGGLFIVLSILNSTAVYIHYKISSKQN